MPQLSIDVTTGRINKNVQKFTRLGSHYMTSPVVTLLLHEHQGELTSELDEPIITGLGDDEYVANLGVDASTTYTNVKIS